MNKKLQCCNRHRYFELKLPKPLVLRTGMTYPSYENEIASIAGYGFDRIHNEFDDRTQKYYRVDASGSQLLSSVEATIIPDSTYGPDAFDNSEVTISPYHIIVQTKQGRGEDRGLCDVS